MSGGRNEGLSDFATKSMQRSDRAFDMGLGWIEKAMGRTNEAISAGGEPEYLRRALDAAQANAADASLFQAQDQGAAYRGAAAPLVAGGNVRQAITPESYGARMAQMVAGSGSARQNARIGSILDAAGAALGQSTGAGQAQVRALSNELGAISMRPAVDPTFSTILSALTAGSAVYGAGQQAGWWGRPGAPPPAAPGSLGPPTAPRPWA